MRRAAAVLGLVTVLGCASDASPPGVQHPEGLPLEVREFVQDQNRCDTLRGEIGDGDPRAAELEDEAALDCAHRAAELKRLRAKYPDDIEVQDALSFFSDEDADGASAD